MASNSVVVASLLVLARAGSLHAGAGAAAKDPCACLSWAETYYEKKAWCGRGHELYFLGKNGFNTGYAATEPITSLPHQVCYDFFKNFMEPACVNVDMLALQGNDTSKEGLQWCYVSAECTDLNGGEYGTNQQGFAQASWNNLQSSTGTNWKYCTSGGDKMLRDMSVHDVIALGKASDVGLPKLFRHAFPAVEVSFPEVSYFLEQLNEQGPEISIEAAVDSVPRLSEDAEFGNSAAGEKEDKVRDIVKSGQATILDSIGHGDEFHVVAGRQVWEMKRIELGNMAYLNGHFFREFDAKCIFSCAKAQERDAVDMTSM